MEQSARGSELVFSPALRSSGDGFRVQPASDQSEVLCKRSNAKQSKRVPGATESPLSRPRRYRPKEKKIFIFGGENGWVLRLEGLSPSRPPAQK